MTTFLTKEDISRDNYTSRNKKDIPSNWRSLLSTKWTIVYEVCDVDGTFQELSNPEVMGDIPDYIMFDKRKKEATVVFILPPILFA